MTGHGKRKKVIPLTTVRAELSQKNEFWISKHAFYTAYHYALQYGEWRDEYERISGGVRAVNYDGMPHGSNVGNPTEAAAIRAAELSAKMQTVQETARLADPEIVKYLLKAVTNEGITYEYLRGIMGIPCGHNRYYKARRKFYYLLSQKLEGK